MNKFSKLFPLAVLSLAITGLAGCATAVNTKDVTKITQTMTGLKICQSPVDKTPQLIFGREQIEYIKVPTGLNGTVTSNQTATSVSDTPTIVSSYELNGSSPVFGRARMTTTFAVGVAGADTLLGGNHEPINIGTGTNQVETVPAALTPSSSVAPVVPAAVPAK